MTGNFPVPASWVWVPPWEPDTVLRAVRHHLNNLLAPVTVAAEILDNGTPESAMLLQAAKRLHHTTTRVGMVLNAGLPKCKSVTVRNFVETLSTASSPSKFASPPIVKSSFTDRDFRSFGQVKVDTSRFVARILQELEPLATGLSLRVESLCFPNGDMHKTLILESKADTPPLTPAEIEVLPYPLALLSGGVGMAILCRECALQGFAVRVSTGASVLEVCIPLLVS